LEDTFSECSDLRIREIIQPEITILIGYIDNLVNNETLNSHIIKPLMDDPSHSTLHRSAGVDVIQLVKSEMIQISGLKEETDFQATVDAILDGNSVIYINGSETALIAGTQGWESRTVEEPETETVVRGPREGFVENLGVNCALLRRKIKSNNLKMEKMVLGRQTKTDICICYIKGIANADMIQTLKRRLGEIKVDSILESGYIEEFIEDAPLSIFPTVGNSEKPDIVAAKILEGRAAVFCDGTPFVLTVPYLFFETLQASEDYYTRSISSTLLRVLRITAFFISISLPSFYVAFLNFHQSVVPLKLLLTITASREGIPFSPFLEAIFMGLTFEILQEAGIRMPRPIGQAVSIVGALVIGDASVRAGLVSNPMVIITALTAISTFILPPLQRVLPYLRIILLIGGYILGLLGIFLLLIMMVVHMCSLRSFGVPYTAPLAPLSVLDLKDTYFRFPHWLMITRPGPLTWQDKGRDKYRMQLNIRKKED
jgi:spore germination protein KA